MRGLRTRWRAVSGAPGSRRLSWPIGAVVASTRRGWRRPRVVPLGQRKGGRHRLGDQRAAAGKLDRTAGDRDLEQLAGLRAVAAPAAAREGEGMVDAG